MESILEPNNNLHGLHGLTSCKKTKRTKKIIIQDLCTSIINKIRRKRENKDEIRIDFIKQTIIVCIHKTSLTFPKLQHYINKIETTEDLIYLSKMIEFFIASIFHDADENGYQYEKNDLLEEIIQYQHRLEIYEEISQALRILGLQRKAKSELELISTKGCDICFRITPPPNKKKRCAQHDRQTNIAGYNKGRRTKTKCQTGRSKSNPRFQLQDCNFKAWLKANAPNVATKLNGINSIFDSLVKLNGNDKLLFEEYERMAGLREGEEIEVFYDQIECTYMLTAEPSEKEKINLGKMGYTYYKINKYNIITQRYFLNAEIWIEAEKSRFHGGKRKGAGQKKSLGI